MSKHSKQVNHFNSALAPDGQMIMSFTGCYLCDEHIRQARHQDGHQLSASSRCPLFRVCWGLGIFGDVSVALCNHHVALVSVVLSFVRPQVTRYLHRVGRTVLLTCCVCCFPYCLVVDLVGGALKGFSRSFLMKL
jgi:hypothetical protein